MAACCGRTRGFREKINPRVGPNVILTQNVRVKKIRQSGPMFHKKQRKRIAFFIEDSWRLAIPCAFNNNAESQDGVRLNTPALKWEEVGRLKPFLIGQPPQLAVRLVECASRACSSYGYTT